MKRVTITVSGRVQGVFFRGFIQKRATELNLKGYVKNLPGDKVEIIAEGNEKDLTKIAEIAVKGPKMSNVLKHNVQYSDATEEFKLFSIRY